jgi:hypothetical protein
VLAYLSRYTHRVGISNRRLLALVRVYPPQRYCPAAQPADTS